MTHQDLIKVAQRWLTNTAHCAVVLTELSTSAGEIPDAIGWYGRNSILVECKISRGDFFADKDKPSRRAERVLGGKRFYLTPKGLVEPEEVPEGWGLLEVYS